MNQKVEIVLVEDNPADVTTTLAALKKANIFNRIHVLRDPANLTEFLLGTGANAGDPFLPPETLILLSLNIAEDQGLDLLRKIKGDQRTKSFPVIILTSSQEGRGVMEGYKLGANACIVKPFELAKFVESVSELRLGWLLIAGDGAARK